MNSLFKSIPPIGLLLFGLLSCSLEDATPPLPLSAVDPLPLAKEFYAQEKPKQVTSSFRIQTEQEFFPFWAGAKSHANGRILIVPAHRKLQVRYEAGYLRRFVFELDASGKVQRGGMLELSGKDSKFLLQNEELLIEGFLAGVKSKELTYLWSDFVARPLDGTQADGRVVTLQREGGGKSRLDAEALRTEFCIDWYWVYSFNGVVVFEVFSHTTCGSASCDSARSADAHDACLDDGVGAGGDGKEVQIIKDPSFKETAADCIYEKLLSINGFKDLASKFEGLGTEFDVLLKIGTTKSVTANGQTWYKGPNQPIEITFNVDRMNRSALEVARTIVHEMIHAEMYRALNTQGLEDSDLSFKETFEEYTRQFFGDEDIHHSYMADYWVDKMANMLELIHPQLGYLGLNDFLSPWAYPTGIPKDFYKALAWEGLKDEDVRAWNNKTAEQKDQIEFHIEKAKYGTKSCN
jgi:hypothetical protein